MGHTVTAALLLGAVTCAGCIERFPHSVGPFATARGTGIVDAGNAVDSGYGASVSFIPNSKAWAFYNVTAELMAMKLDDDVDSDLLQTRLYGGMEFTISSSDNCEVVIGPIIGLAYTDLGDAPGWSVDHTALLAGLEATFLWGPGFFTGPGAEPGPGVVASVRWVHVGWELDRPGSPERDLDALELTVGAAWRF